MGNLIERVESSLCGLCHSDGQKLSFSAAGALSGANNYLFQTSSRKIQSETEKHCVAKFSCRLFSHVFALYLYVLESSGVSSRQSSLAVQIKKVLAFFSSPLFIDLLGLVYPLA